MPTANNMLLQGATWLASHQKQFASFDVIYRRGTNSVSLSAVHGRGQNPMVADGGLVMVATDKTDWIITAADLILPHVGLTLPRAGDTITQADTGEIFTVVANDGQNEYQDIPPGIQIRIHTKKMGS